jgi:hypothetical protein
MIVVMSNVFFIGVLGFSVVGLLFPFHVVSGVLIVGTLILPERSGECHAFFSPVTTDGQGHALRCSELPRDARSRYMVQLELPLT